MKRKRDIQGKFTLKNHDYRQVRSLRLTESTWKKLGMASECRGITRADLLENLVQQNKEIFPDSRGIEPLNSLKIGSIAQKSFNKDELNFLADKVLQELRLGKQASSYKLVKKSLKRLIELILVASK
ncbi:MAG: hypothetical protein QNJ65_06920 [Xenococcaceae cyanobacterium MO_234.B1]|nr:hypothetical protein [Xenococcaceae cyanobacterium MO_234.B1]